MPTKSSSTPYIVAVVIMALIGIAGVLFVTALRPDKDNTALIATILGFVAPTGASILAFMKSNDTHTAVNGRLQEMVDAAREIGYAEGMSGRRGLRLVPPPRAPRDPLSPVSDEQDPPGV